MNKEKLFSLVMCTCKKKKNWPNNGNCITKIIKSLGNYKRKIWDLVWGDFVVAALTKSISSAVLLFAKQGRICAEIVNPQLFFVFLAAPFFS